MKTRRFLTVSVIVLVLSAGLVVGGRDGIAPAAAPPANAGQPFDAILTLLTQLQMAVNNLQTRVNGLPTTQVDLRGVTQNWDKTLPANDSSDPCDSSRFTCVMGGFGVRDNETGLVWTRHAGVTPATWIEARQGCLGNTSGGRAGWRLPSIEELASLVDPTVAFPGPTLPDGHPFVVFLPSPIDPFSFYWTATTRADFPMTGNTTTAWIVSFGNGFLGGASLKTDTLLVWCVRGDGPLSAY